VLGRRAGSRPVVHYPDPLEAADRVQIEFGVLFERFVSQHQVGLADAGIAGMSLRRNEVIETASMVPVQPTRTGNKQARTTASSGYSDWVRVCLGRDCVMEPWALIAQLASAFRDFVAPRYRPELHYMRGPGPASARRARSQSSSKTVTR
jgi:hypothetical protein